MRQASPSRAAEEVFKFNYWIMPSHFRPRRSLLAHVTKFSTYLSECLALAPSLYEKDEKLKSFHVDRRRRQRVKKKDEKLPKNVRLSQQSLITAATMMILKCLESHRRLHLTFRGCY